MLLNCGLLELDPQFWTDLNAILKIGSCILSTMNTFRHYYVRIFSVTCCGLLYTVFTPNHLQVLAIPHHQKVNFQALKHFVFTTTLLSTVAVSELLRHTSFQRAILLSNLHDLRYWRAARKSATLLLSHGFILIYLLPEIISTSKWWSIRRIKFPSQN